jgi:hypothetical protein
MIAAPNQDNASGNDYNSDDLIHGNGFIEYQTGKNNSKQVIYTEYWL